MTQDFHFYQNSYQNFALVKPVDNKPTSRAKAILLSKNSNLLYNFIFANFQSFILALILTVILVFAKILTEKLF